MANVTINENQRLYVIPGHGGFSCLGFDVAARQARERLEWLRDRSAIQALQIAPNGLAGLGTLDLYSQLAAINSAIHVLHLRTGGYCPTDLTPQLKGHEGERVEVVDEFGERRRFVVGKSGGYIPVHLELKSRRSCGGACAARVYRSVRVLERVR